MKNVSELTASTTFRSDKLKAVRTKVGISQGSLGRLIPMHQSELSKIEKGHRAPTPEQSLRLCDIFGVDEDFFYQTK